jgi:hypothetical protein
MRSLNVFFVITTGIYCRSVKLEKAQGYFLAVETERIRHGVTSGRMKGREREIKVTQHPLKTGKQIYKTSFCVCVGVTCGVDDTFCVCVSYNCQRLI